EDEPTVSVRARSHPARSSYSAGRTTAVGTPDRSARAAASQSRSETNAATRYEVSGSPARSRLLWARLPAPEANSTIGRGAPGSVLRTPPLLPVDSWPPGVPGRCSVV